jgi:mannose-6-phosphate isomerase-like protein (cupin superfamily)
MAELVTSTDHGSFDTHAIAEAFPEKADTLLLDHYMTDAESASTRVFRVYRETPPHHHEKSDEHLFVLSGRGRFWMGDPSQAGEFGPGHLLVFKRGTVHALPAILDHPVVFLAIDAPRRDPKDVIFENPEDGSPEQFIQQAPGIVP